MDVGFIKNPSSHQTVASIGAARRLGAKRASFTGIAEVFLAVLYAWLLLGQLPSAVQFTGGAFMLAGVVLVHVDENQQRRANPLRSYTATSFLRPGRGGIGMPAVPEPSPRHRLLQHHPGRDPQRGHPAR